MNLVMGPTILRRCGPQKPSEQGHHGSDVLDCPGEVWEGFVILDDPLIHVTGRNTRTPTVFVALELRVFLLKLESCFFELLVPSPQLLYLQARWGPCIPLDHVVEVVCWGSPSLMDAIDVSLGGTRHETFSRGVMAPPARVRVRGRLLFSCEKVVEIFHDVFGHPHELVVCGGWRRALLHRVANGLCGVTEIGRERCRGAPDEVF